MVRAEVVPAISLPRRLEPEWLDELPADDPRAMRSRRDLKRINGWMLQAAIMKRLLLAHPNGPPRRIVELGAGDGTFMLAVARRLAKRWPLVTLTFVDRQNIVTPETHDGFRKLGWRTESVSADVFAFLASSGERADIVTANLFLHHFPDESLRRLFAGVSKLSPLFVACEPSRSQRALLGSRLLFVIGCNDVSRHDAVVSVRAGFRNGELSALWPQDGAWRLDERTVAPFTHCFVAERDV
jgi:hypothetical protein